MDSLIVSSVEQPVNSSLLIFVESATTIERRSEHSSNVLRLIDAMELGMVAEVKDLQAAKACFPKDVTEFGTTIECNELPYQAAHSIVFNKSGRVREVKDLQLYKASVRIDNRVEDKMSFVQWRHRRKVCFGMLVTPFLTRISVTELMLPRVECESME